MSQFDPNSFLDMQVSDSNSTSSIPVPAGEHLAVIEKIDCRKWSKRDDPSVSGLALDIVYNIDSPAVKELLGRDKVTVTQGVMLDLNASGGLEMGKGKNVALGRLREACNLNQAGQPFSFRQLEGKVVKVQIKHEPSKSPNAQPGDVYANVGGVARAA